MVLVDASVWIDHLRSSSADLRRLLDDVQVAVHPFVIGELACGRLARRGEVLALLRRLPSVPIASDDEAHALVEMHALAGSGLGWVDVHLLASARVARVRVWSKDRRLAAAAARLALEF